MSLLKSMVVERMSDVDVCPTRMELLNVGTKLALSRKGYNMLKKKRDALIREHGAAVREVEDSRRDVGSFLKECFCGAKLVEMQMGAVGFRNVAYNRSKRIVVGVDYEKVVGVKVPVVDAQLSEEGGVSYSFSGTPPALDRVVDDFRKASVMVAELAGLEKKVHVLGEEIKRTRRKVNALEKVNIKNLEAARKYIRSYLDEMEREDYSRLKHIKEVIKGENRAIGEV